MFTLKLPTVALISQSKGMTKVIKLVKELFLSNVNLMIILDEKSRVNQGQ